MTRRQWWINATILVVWFTIFSGAAVVWKLVFSGVQAAVSSLIAGLVLTMAGVLYFYILLRQHKKEKRQ